MKTIGIWNRYESLSTANYMLIRPNAPIGDNLLAPFVALREAGLKRGVEIKTLDLVPDFKKLDGIVFVDFPSDSTISRRALAADCAKYLINFEPPAVLALTPHDFTMFDRVFTWDDDLVGTDPRFVKIHYPIRFPDRMPRGDRTRLVCMFASNKMSDHPLELYSERRYAIEWFKRHAPQDFDLYGPGWPGGIARHIPAGEKLSTLARYRFVICYENMRNAPGYITEKILDCFAAGTIPIYLGAPNVGAYIGNLCFADAREFLGYQPMWEWMKSMSQKEYDARRDAIEGWMKSESARPFSVERFVTTILDGIASATG